MELNRPFLVIQIPFNFLRSPLYSEEPWVHVLSVRSWKLATRDQTILTGPSLKGRAGKHGVRDIEIVNFCPYAA